MTLGYRALGEGEQAGADWPSVMFASDDFGEDDWLLPVCLLFGTGETKLQPVHAVGHDVPTLIVH